jgi:hypothetical protein
MYGLGGGFGGMPYQSPGSAIVQGIEAGQNFMQRAQQEEDRHQQLQLQMSREDRRDRMDQAHIDWMERNTEDRDKRQAWKEAFDAHKEMGGELEAEGNDIRSRYRNPDGTLDVQRAMQDPQYADYAQRVQKYNVGRDALMDSLYGPYLKQQTDRAKEMADGMVKQGDPNFDVSDPGNAKDLHHAVAVCSRMDPANFLQGQNGEPSPFEDAAAKIHNGFTNNNAQDLYTGVSSVFGNQFEAGRIGYMDPLGGTVMSAQLNKDRPFVPSPDGSSMHPVLDVGGETSDGFTRQPYAPAPTAGFDHPTVNDLMSVTPEKMLNNLGMAGTMQKLLAHPVLQANLAKACQEPDQKTLDFAQAYTARGNKPSLGGMHFTRENADGGVSQMYAPYLPSGGVGPAIEIANSRGSPKPEKPDRTPTTEKTALIEDLHKRGILTDEQYTGALQNEAGVPGIKQHAPSEGEAKAEGEFAAEHAMGKMGVYKDEFGRYLWSADSPAGTPEEQAHQAGKPLSPGDRSKLDAQMLQAREQAHLKSYGGGAPSGATTTIQQTSPEDQQEKDQVISLLNRAREVVPDATPQQIVEQAIARGKLQPSARRWATARGPEAEAGKPVGTPPPKAAAAPTRGIGLSGTD